MAEFTNFEPRERFVSTACLINAVHPGGPVGGACGERFYEHVSHIVG